jgi:hypothetical protein
MYLKTENADLLYQHFQFFYGLTFIHYSGNYLPCSSHLILGFIHLVAYFCPPTG